MPLVRGPLARQHTSHSQNIPCRAGCVSWSSCAQTVPIKHFRPAYDHGDTADVLGVTPATASIVVRPLSMTICAMLRFSVASASLA